MPSVFSSALSMCSKFVYLANSSILAVSTDLSLSRLSWPILSSLASLALERVCCSSLSFSWSKEYDVFNWRGTGRPLVGAPKSFLCGDCMISFGTLLLFKDLAGDVSKGIVSSGSTRSLMLSSRSSLVFVLLFDRRQQSPAFGDCPPLAITSFGEW